jgi:hypothetical protein
VLQEPGQGVHTGALWSSPIFTLKTTINK